jgi:hypothetical protein
VADFTATPDRLATSAPLATGRSAAPGQLAPLVPARQPPPQPRHSEVKPVYTEARVARAREKETVLYRDEVAGRGGEGAGAVVWGGGGSGVEGGVTGPMTKQ